MRQYAVLILTVGVHTGHTLRQGLAPQMVIQNNNVTSCRGHRLMAQRSAIHTDDQVMRAAQFLHRRHIWPITFINSIRHIQGGTASQLAQPINQQGGRCAPIHVVIRKNRDPLALCHGAQDPAGGGFHIFQGPWIRQ